MFFLLSLLLSVSPAPAPPPPPDETILKYEQALRDSEDKHRAYLQSLESGAAALIVLFTGYLGWLNWKTRKDLVAGIHKEYRKFIVGLRKDYRNSVEKIKEENRNAVEKAAQQYESEALKSLGERIHELDLQIAGRTSVVAATARGSADSAIPKKVLWVDDHPQNNDEERVLIQSRYRPVKIDSAESTEQAIEMLKATKYDVIIQDMAREKNDRAGLDLLKSLPESRKDIPVIVYCSPRMARQFGGAAKALGARETTWSATALLHSLQSILGSAQPA